MDQTRTPFLRLLVFFPEVKVNREINHILQTADAFGGVLVVERDKGGAQVQLDREVFAEEILSAYK